MFKNLFGPSPTPATQQTEATLNAAAATAGDTATVRRIVGKLEAMPPDQARLVASAAYTLARVANADLEISDAETAAIEAALQERGVLDEPTAILVTEMAKLQAKTVGGTEDYVVTREFRNLSTEEQRHNVLRASFAIAAANGTISSEENAEVNEIARELDIEPADVNQIRAAYHDQLSSVQEVRRIAAGESEG